MKTKKLKGILIVTAVIVVAGYSVYVNQEKEPLTGVMLENVEALAGDESGSDPNIFYGKILKKCKDDNGRLIGETCTDGRPEDQCKLSAVWGECN